MARTPENSAHIRREPTIRMWHPDWWHVHGLKMEVSPKEEDRTNKRLVIKGSAAEVVISRKDDYNNQREWFVDWKVVQSQQEFSSGRTIYRERELSAAFEIDTNDVGEFPADILDRFGGDSASQGKYIRYKNFLNIPNPGTGHDGDPNVSIEIDGNMKLGVSRLLFDKSNPWK